MTKREARTRAIGGLMAATSLAAGGMGDAFPQYNDDLGDWTEREEIQLRAAFAVLHDELSRRYAKLTS